MCSSILQFDQLSSSLYPAHRHPLKVASFVNFSFAYRSRMTREVVLAIFVGFNILIYNSVETRGKCSCKQAILYVRTCFISRPKLVISRLRMPGFSSFDSCILISRKPFLFLETHRI